MASVNTTASITPIIVYRMKKSIWDKILKVVIAVASAILGDVYKRQPQNFVTIQQMMLYDNFSDADNTDDTDYLISRPQKRCIR